MYGLRLIKNCRIPDPSGREFYIDQDASYARGKQAGSGPGAPEKSRPPQELLRRRAAASAKRQLRPSTSGGAETTPEARKVPPEALQHWQRCMSAPVATGAHRLRRRMHDPGVTASLGEAPGGLGEASGSGRSVAAAAAAVVGAVGERYRTTASDYFVPANMGPGLPVPKHAMHSEMPFRRSRAPDEDHLKSLHTAMHPGVLSSSAIYVPDGLGPEIPMCRHRSFSETHVRNVKPAEEAHLRNLPGDFLPFERPAETGKFRFFANKSIGESPHFYPAKPHEGLGQARLRAGRGEFLDVVAPVSHL